MKCDKKYYKDLDVLRVVACLAILFYHLGILKGGYLAVCTFFVLSGYFACIGALKKEKFSIIEYYKNRFKKIYLPLIIVVFLTIFTLFLVPNISWLNLKPETTSVLLGYNNFWQINANLDYFTRNISSPFMHFWYISILLQFDLIFPFLFLILRKIGEKISKILPCIFMATLSIMSAIFFFFMSAQQIQMEVYYGTLTRIFSLLFGFTLGFTHSYYRSFIPNFAKKEPYYKIIFSSYLVLIFLFFIFVEASSKYFAISMILVSLMSCRLIDYGTILIKNELSFLDKAIKILANTSYEIYLVQYPILYLFQAMNIANRNILGVISIILISFLIHFILNKTKNAKLNGLRYVGSFLLLILTSCGIYEYCIAKDYTEEMQKLEEQLAQNEKILQEKQAEYVFQQKQEEMDWISTLEDFENSEEKVSEIVKNLSVVGIGDSVMLGAINNLYQEFPKGYFDAKISRTAWVVNDILLDLKGKNKLGSPIILNLGANGDCSDTCKLKIIQTCENREIFWVTVTNDNEVHINKKLKALADTYENIHIIDWETISRGHSEYFIADGIHLTEQGREAYTTSVYDAIYEVYIKEYNEKKEEVLKQHEEEQKTKISFYGNNLLVNAFNELQEEFPLASYHIMENWNYEKLKEELKQAKEENTLNHKIVLAFDREMNVNKKQYQELLELLEGYDFYFLSTSENQIQEKTNIANENSTVIKFYEELKNHNNYLMADKKHLTEEGNKALREVLKNKLNVIS